MTDNSPVEASNAARKRLVLAADAARRKIERELHAGVQQHLVALAVSLQLAGELTDSDPAAAKTLLEEMRRNVQQALDETAQLAQRIYPQLDAVGFAAALRSAAVSAGVRASVDVDVDRRFPPELLATAYWCWVEVLERAAAETRATITVREQDEALAFEIVADGDPPGVSLEHVSDRVDALGGTIWIASPPGQGTSLRVELSLDQ